MKIAVDFDGTIVENRYPRIGKPKLFAFETLLQLQKKGHQLILWTYRKGEYLEEAVEYCRENGIEFYAVNKSFPEEKFDPSMSRKINVDLFIDDKNLGGFPGWREVWSILHPEMSIESNFKKESTGKSTFLGKIFGKRWQKV